MPQVKNDAMPLGDGPPIHRVRCKCAKKLVALGACAGKFGEQATGRSFQHWHKQLDARNARVATYYLSARTITARFVKDRAGEFEGLFGRSNLAIQLRRLHRAQGLPESLPRLVSRANEVTPGDQRLRAQFFPVKLNKLC